MMSKGISPAALQAVTEGNLDNFLTAITPGGIERQEKSGQDELVRNSTLPKEMGWNTTREQLERIGIVFGEDVDNLFVNVTLPAGWKKQATSHAMWSELLDEKGRRRASIFYKAAFYDRNARITLERRYRHDKYQPCLALGEPTDYETATHTLTTVKDGDKPIVTIGIAEKDNYELSDQHEKLAVAWLNEHFPNWQDPMAYWD